MPDDDVKGLLAGLDAEDRADAEHFLESWDLLCLRGTPTPEGRAMRLEALKTYLIWGEGDGGALLCRPRLQDEST